MGHLFRTVLSRHLTPCQFCGDRNPELKSSPCTFVRSDLFQAQVHCGHCGATGTRYCGEENLQEAEIQAVQAWVNASTPKRGFFKAVSDANKWFFTIWIGIWIGNAALPVDSSTTVFIAMLGGSLALGVVLGVIQGRETYRREIARWEKMKADIEA